MHQNVSIVLYDHSDKNFIIIKKNDNYVANVYKIYS